MIKRIMPLVIVALAGAMTMTACTEDPCLKLAPPTTAELAAVKAGAQVERDGPNGTECDLVSGRWQRETE